MADSKKRGRQPDASSKSGQIRTLLGTGLSVSEIAKKLGCTPALVYNVKARMAGGPRKRGPVRPRKAQATSTSSMDGLAGILSAVQNAERDRVRLRQALEKIKSVVSEALS